MTQYDANSIEVLKGLEPAKKRPGMYTDTERPNHLAQEVIDNAMDEAAAGYADRIDVTVHEDGSLSVTDNGRGMPFDWNKKERKRAHDLILTELHSGGKFTKDSYTYSGGLHGVGVSVVNALSSTLELSSRRDGQRIDATFNNGKKSQENIEDDTTPGTGTTIRFLPAEKYFNTTKLNSPALLNALKSKAVLLSGLTLTYYDEESGREETFCYDNGLFEYFDERCLTSADPIPAGGWHMAPKWTGGEAQIVVSFASDGQGVVMESFANMIPTIQGGTHVKALRDAVSGAVRNVGNPGVDTERTHSNQGRRHSGIECADIDQGGGAELCWADEGAAVERRVRG